MKKLLLIAALFATGNQIEAKTSNYGGNNYSNYGGNSLSDNSFNNNNYSNSSNSFGSYAGTTEKTAISITVGKESSLNVQEGPTAYKVVSGPGKIITKTSKNGNYKVLKITGPGMIKVQAIQTAYFQGKPKATRKRVVRTKHR